MGNVMTLEEENYYSILGLPIDADIKDIKKVYLKHVKDNLPENIDIGNQGQLQDFSNRFSQITKAYKTLVDDNLRQKYDDELKRNINFFIFEQTVKLKKLIINGYWKSADDNVEKMIKFSNSPILLTYRAMINIFKGSQAEYNLNICINYSENNPFQGDYHAILAYAYYGIEDINNAHFYILKALKWEPENILALELQKKIKKVLSEQSGLFSKFTNLLHRNNT